MSSEKSTSSTGEHFVVVEVPGQDRPQPSRAERAAPERVPDEPEARPRDTTGLRHAIGPEPEDHDA